MAEVMDTATSARLDLLRSVGDAVKLVTLYGDALRLSGASDEAHADQAVRASCVKLSTAIVTHLAAIFESSGHPAPESFKCVILTLLLRTGVLHCQSRLLAAAAQHMKQRVTRRSSAAAKQALIDTVNLLGAIAGGTNSVVWQGSADATATAPRHSAPINDLQDYVVEASVALRASHLLNSWAACFLEMLAADELSKRDASDMLRRVCTTATTLVDASTRPKPVGTYLLDPLPAVQYMLTLHLVRLTALLDGGTAYGMPSDAPAVPVTCSAPTVARRGPGETVDSATAVWTLQAYVEWLVEAEWRRQQGAGSGGAGHSTRSCSGVGAGCVGGGSSRQDGSTRGSSSGGGGGVGDSGPCGDGRGGAGAAVDAWRPLQALNTAVTFDLGIRIFKSACNAWMDGPGGQPDGGAGTAGAAQPPTNARLLSTNAGDLAVAALRAAIAAHQCWADSPNTTTPTTGPRRRCRRHAPEARLRTLWSTYVGVMESVMDRLRTAVPSQPQTMSLAPRGWSCGGAVGSTGRYGGLKVALGTLEVHGWGLDMATLAEELLPSGEEPVPAANPAAPSPAAAAILSSRALRCAQRLLLSYPVDGVALFPQPHLWHELLLFAPQHELVSLVSAVATTLQVLTVAVLDGEEEDYKAKPRNALSGIPKWATALDATAKTLLRASCIFSPERLHAYAEDVGGGRSTGASSSEPSSRPVGAAAAAAAAGSVQRDAGPLESPSGVGGTAAAAAGCAGGPVGLAGAAAAAAAANAPAEDHPDVHMGAPPQPPPPPPNPMLAGSEVSGSAPGGFALGWEAQRGGLGRRTRCSGRRRECGGASVLPQGVAPTSGAGTTGTVEAGCSFPIRFGGVGVGSSSGSTCTERHGGCISGLSGSSGAAEAVADSVAGRDARAAGPGLLAAGATAGGSAAGPDAPNGEAGLRAAAALLSQAALFSAGGPETPAGSAREGSDQQEPCLRMGLLWNLGSERLLPVLCRGLRLFYVLSMQVYVPELVEAWERILSWCELLLYCCVSAERQAAAGVGSNGPFSTAAADEGGAAAALAGPWRKLLAEEVDVLSVLALTAHLLQDSPRAGRTLGAVFARTFRLACEAFPAELQQMLEPRQGGGGEGGRGRRAGGGAGGGGGDRTAPEMFLWLRRMEPLSPELLDAVLSSS